MNKYINHMFTPIFLLFSLLFVIEFLNYQKQFNLASSYTNNIALNLQKYGYDVYRVSQLVETSYFDEYEVFEENSNMITFYTVVTYKKYENKFNAFSFLFNDINCSLVVSKIV